MPGVAEAGVVATTAVSSSVLSIALIFIIVVFVALVGITNKNAKVHPAPAAMGEQRASMRSEAQTDMPSEIDSLIEALSSENGVVSQSCAISTR